MMSNEDPAKVQAAADAFKEGKLLAHLFPEPDYAETPVASAFPEITGSAEATVREDSWWDWRVTNWGTKWDVGSDSEEADISDNGKTLTLSFDSAWSPPLGVFERAVEDGWEVKAYYYEPGMGFAGIWDNGEDLYFDLPGTSEEVADLLPEELNDMFGISENMAMWEEDEEDEEVDN